MGQLQSETNAPLFYAQRLVSLYNLGFDDSTQQDQYALLTGAWLCLKESWQCWLNELSTYMNLERTERYQFNDLSVLFNTGLPEGQLLQGLIENSESWLAIMLQKTLKPTERQSSKVKQTDQNLNFIPLVSQEELDELDDVQVIRKVMAEFKKYIEAVRERQIEW